MTKARTGTKKTPGAATGAATGAAPSARPSAKPSASATKPPAKPAGKPTAKPAAKPAGKAAARPAAKAPAKATPKSAAKPAAAGGAAGAAADGAGGMRPVRKVEAPKPFQREYRKWLDRLIALRQQLVIDGERLGEEGLKALEQEVSVDHMADFGSDSYEQDTTLSLIENKSEALRDVDEAIRRIETKTYGLCDECEQMIPTGRLEVIPHARFCVVCQAAREGSS